MMDSFCNRDVYFFDQHVKMTTQFLVDNMYLYRVQRHSRAIVKKKINTKILMVIKKSNLFVQVSLFFYLLILQHVM